MGSERDFKESVAVALLLAVAFLYRYWHLTSTGWMTPDETFLLGMKLLNSSVFHFSDSDTYTTLAKDHLEGRGMNIPFNPPFTTFVLIACYRLFGYDFFAAKLVYAALGTAALLFIYLVARVLFGKTEALVTLLLCAVSFTMISLVGALNIENVYLFALSVALCMFVMLYHEVSVAAKYPVGFAFFFGIASACAALTRSEFLLILAAMFFMGLFRGGWSMGQKLGVAVAVVVGLSLTVSPWAYRNYRFMTEFNKKIEKVSPEGLPLFVPFSMNGPFNFLEGHNSRANGTYAPAVIGYLKGGYIGSLNVAEERHISYVRDGFRLGWDFMIHNPGRELELLPVKMKVFLQGFANGFFLKNFPVGMTGGSESMADSFVPDSKLMLYLGLPFFLLGLIVVIRRGGAPTRYLPLVAVGAVLFVTIVFYGLSRLVYPMLPYYFMTIAIGLLFVFRRLAGILKRPLPSASTAAVIVAVIFLLFGFAQSREKTVVFKQPAGPYGKFRVSYDRSLSKDL